MAAIPFRHDPYPFRMPKKLYDDLIVGRKGPLEFFVFGLSFSISDDKIKKLRSLDHFSVISFSEFVIEFQSSLKTFSEATLASSRTHFSKHRRTDPFSRYGYYDTAGRWLMDPPSEDPTFIKVLSAKEFESMKNKENTDSYAASTSSRAATDYSDNVGQAYADAAKRRGRDASGQSSTAASMGFRTDQDYRGETFSTHSQEEAAKTSKMSSEQAEEIAVKSTVLQTRVNKKYDLSHINLSSLQREKRYKEIHVPVSRGNYNAVTTSIVRGKPGGYVITGPTGCGKSTVALLELFNNGGLARGLTAIVAEPTQANAANILHEFINILPNMVSAGIIKGSVPACDFIAPTVSKKPYPQLAVTTVEKVLEYFYHYGDMPKVDFFIIDEFHLPVPAMVEIVELFRTFNFNTKYALVSATAPGISVSSEMPRACSHMYGNLQVGKIPSRIERSDLDPRRWYRMGDGTVAIVAPNVSMAKKLHEVYRSWGLRSFLVTRHTTVTQYMKAATDYKPETVFVLEPGVEAGVTLSISVLISMGCSTAIRYDGKVVTEDTQPLDANAQTQRAGRGGRVKPTKYITPRVSTTEVPTSAADYFRAQALVKVVAMGARLEKLNADSVFEQFPKLSTLNRAFALRAVASGGDPFLAVYRTNSDGKVYVECGGDGLGFSELAKSELFVYRYPKGFYIAPISDFSDLNSKPDTFVLRSHQIEVAKLIVSSIPGLSNKYDLDDLVGMVVGKFDVYISDFFDMLLNIFDKKEASPFTMGSFKPAEVKDFIRESPPIVKLFDYLKTEPLGVEYLRIQSTSNGKIMTQHSFLYGKKALHFAFDSRYMSGSSVNVKKLSEDVYESLRGLLSIEILMNGAQHRCVDLETYKDKIPSDHKWFATNVLS